MDVENFLFQHDIQHGIYNFLFSLTFIVPNVDLLQTSVDIDDKNGMISYGASSLGWHYRTWALVLLSSGNILSHLT